MSPAEGRSPSPTSMPDPLISTAARRDSTPLVFGRHARRWQCCILCPDPADDERGSTVPDVHEFGSLAAYPGRGVLLNWGDNGLHWIYFVTGRSLASRARRAVARNGSIVVEADNDSAAPDALRHYTCAKQTRLGLLVGNGDHVDQIAESTEAGVDLPAALALIEPEPDPPIYTPRIGALITSDPVLFSVARSSEGTTRRVVSWTERRPDSVAMLCTYAGTVEDPVGSAPLQLFSDMPSRDLVEAVWNALDPHRRVLLVAGHGASISSRRVLSNAEHHP